MKRVYLDHNATTPLHPSIKEHLLEWAEQWGNPSSIHWQGRAPKALLRDSRKAVASVIGCDPVEVVFTSGGTESDNMALKGAYWARKDKDRNKVLISDVEHPAVLKSAEDLIQFGAKIVRIPVSREGALDIEFLQKELDESVALVSIMFANNETGDVFPIKEIASMAHAKGALVHTDAVQALGKVEINLHDLGVDYASFSGHKFYALKGCGVLFIKKQSSFHPVQLGGGQERKRRGGTENLLAIASLAHMANKWGDLRNQLSDIEELRDHMQTRILNEISNVTVTGGKGVRTPNTLNLVIPGVDGESLLMNLDMKGFAVSTGAACSSGNPEPSPTLLAMGLSRDEAQNSLRLSLGFENSKEEIDLFVDTLKSVVTKIRSIGEVHNV